MHIKELKYTVNQQKHSDKVRWSPAVVFVHMLDLVLVIGGNNAGYLNSVSVHSVQFNTWYRMHQKLNVARANASACILGTIIYVFCGTTNDYPTFTNTIEKISIAGLSPGRNKAQYSW